MWHFKEDTGLIMGHSQKSLSASLGSYWRTSGLLDSCRIIFLKYIPARMNIVYRVKITLRKTRTLDCDRHL